MGITAEVIVVFSLSPINKRKTGLKSFFKKEAVWQHIGSEK